MIIEAPSSLGDTENESKEGRVTILPNTKTTKDGILLVPQPTDDPEEPLVGVFQNWSFWKKHLALIALGFETFLVKFTATMLAPGAHGLALQFHTSARRASYIASAASVVPSVAPFLWIPLSQRIGRRPVLLGGNFIAIMFTIGLARSETYAQALTLRIFAMFFASVGICITPAAISDMFFLHEKGKRMGYNTFLLVCAPYLGGVVGGSIQYNENLGWRWAMYIAALLYVALLFAQVFLVPETIYIKKQANAESEEIKRSIWRRLGFRKPHNEEPMRVTWTRNFRMFAFPAVVLPSFWFSICFMTEVANTAGFPLQFGIGTHYNFNTQQIGFCSFSGFIGAVLGEFVAGPICDFVAKRHLKKGEKWVPEMLLKVAWTGVVFIPAGVLLYGLELNYPTSWAAALTGIAIFAFGQEVLITVLLTYMTDCYPLEAAECAVVFQFFLNLNSYHPPFYVPQWILQPGGAKVPYIVFAVLPILFFPFGVGIFMWRGPQIRAKGRIFAPRRFR
ncbi:MFS general substrate transporter [Lophium mytilinum]|uniref:MFS general substrate transporter n=1 Tax=Lophium mytilinum TaxID=390894 RepID=A0A6A6QNK1_9PEZI|nr:MFS general substrate transporter [Lophium mytilinum]